MNKQIIGITALAVAIFAFGIVSLFVLNPKETIQTQPASAKEVSPEITADGSVTSANIASLHFQTGGKVVALYAKEGDKVYAGQSIAQLDTYILQQQLTAALNTYRSTRDSFDQVHADKQDVAISDTIKRIFDQNQATLDNTTANVAIANYAVQLATLTTPISGVVTHEDITTANVNITPTTTFVVADPQTLVFNANVPQYQIDFVHVGSRARIQLDGLHGRQYAGTITKIYPQKVTLANGQQVYKVEITADGLVNNAALDQTGSATITSDTTRGVFLIPAWAIVNHQYVWVSENNKPTLKKIIIGNAHGSDYEVKSGLKENDEVIVNPQSIASQKYILL
jgi:RND family efflux transporter MFP subunit